jgi:hypothetical protein
MFPLQVCLYSYLAFMVLTRIYNFQSLPTPKHAKAPSSAPPDDDDDFIDPTSATALAIQPLLEQEALLETFVEEAKAQRKFEDAKTLRVNLGEIRQEIERVLAAEGLKGKRARRGR